MDLKRQQQHKKKNNTPTIHKIIKAHLTGHHL